MTHKCPVCGNTLTPYGTAGMTCLLGHHFLRSEIEGDQVVLSVRRRRVSLPAWVPGAVLGGLALVITLLEAVI